MSNEQDWPLAATIHDRQSLEQQHASQWKEQYASYDKPFSPERRSQTLGMSSRSNSQQSRGESSASSDVVDVEKQESKVSAKHVEQKDEKDPNLVEWDGPEDPENPFNWSVRKRWLYTGVMGSVTLVVTFASSVFSTATMITSEIFQVSSEVMILGTALFVLGFAWGPIVWGPFSELYGRKPPLYIGYAIFAIFQIPVAVAQNLETIFVCRFLGGFFASAPLATIGGILADMWDPVNRGIAMGIFSGATFIGPIAGPIVGGFITQSYLGWRWTAWITLIMAAFFGTLGFFVVPETYAPVLLKRRAAKRRFETKNWALHSKLDEERITAKDIFQRYTLRPFTMLIMEPILMLMTLYMSFIYGIIYLLFEAFPVSYEEERGYNLGVGALPFLGIGVGVLCGISIITWNSKTRFARLLKEHGKVEPEERLVPMMVGGILLPVGLFWWAWTSFPSISPWPQIVAGIPVGAGLQLIFLQGFNYIIDSYTLLSNSALSANTFVRSWIGAGFPMFAVYMFHNLGTQWAASLLGFLAIAMFPVPILFYIYGPRIRTWSRFAQS